MSWLDKLKEFFSTKEEIEKEHLSFEQLPSKLDVELKENLESKGNIKKLIQERVSKFILEIEGNLKILREINIDQIKEVEKIKFVVKENLTLYISHLNNFLANLGDTENLEVEKYIKKINQILQIFKISSRNAFEKATILIGKELGDTKDTINKFIGDLNNIVNENKKVFEDTPKIDKTKDSFQKLHELDINQKQLDKDIESLNSKIEEIKEKVKKVEEKIKNIKESIEYKQNLGEKEKLSNEKEKLERTIQELKQKIDLKFLSKYFHSDEKKTRIIKKYAENFKSALEEDKNLELVKLIKEAKNIDFELSEIKKKIQKLKVTPSSAVDNKLESLEQEKQKLEAELISKETETNEEIKKRERLNKKGENLTEDIKNQAKSMNIEIS